MTQTYDVTDMPELGYVPPDEALLERFTKLRKPFAPEQISKLPRSSCRACTDSPRKRCDNPNHTWVMNCPDCGGRHSSATIHLDYVGHADVTSRLLEVDPMWNWQPLRWDQAGNPQRDADGGMWISLTVLGVTRLGYGDAQGKRGPNGTKELIGDAIRNAAMRFGVAVDLWSKSDAAASKNENQLDPPAPRQQQPERPAQPAEPVRPVAWWMSEAANLRGQKDPSVQLWNRAGQAGLHESRVTDPDTEAETTLGALIVKWGTETPPRKASTKKATPAEAAAPTEAPAPVAEGKCEGVPLQDGTVVLCVREAGHEGRHIRPPKPEDSK